MQQRTVDPTAFPIDVGGGRRIYVNPADSRGSMLIETNGTFNPESLSLWGIALSLSEWDAVVDVGANYGQMLACMDLSSFSTIVAFEPSDRIVPYLSRTIAELDWSVELRTLAVSNEIRNSAEFASDLSWSGSSTLGSSLDATAGGHDYLVGRVATTTLDDQFGRAKFSSMCLKVSVEGHEFDVLEGGRLLFNDLERIVLMVEILHMPIDRIAELARQWEMYLLDRSTGKLVRVWGIDSDYLRTVTESGWLYPQDALLVRGIEKGRLS